MRNLKILLTTVALIGFCLSIAAKTKTAPNVIYILPDQYRNYSLGFWSQDNNSKHIQGNPDPVSTPKLDKLANGGVVFSRAISNYPLCSPYRGMLMSGMYPNKNGIRNNCRSDRSDHLNQDIECITDVFSKEGYQVAYFGKCHWLKNDPEFTEDGTYVGTTEAPGGNYINRYDTYIPKGKNRHSIDYFYQTLKDDHFNPLVYSSDPKTVGGKKDGELDMPHRFSAEIESEKLIDFLGNSHGQRDNDKPFFVMWALNPPHNPWTEESTYMEFYDQYTDSGVVDTKKLLSHRNADHKVGAYAPYYFANVSAVDHFIGKVLDYLEANELDENTIIVFSSDHGEMLGSHGKEGKNYPEIESLNVPFVINWKGKLKPRVDNLILSVPDVMPTLLGLAGLDKAIPESVQGTNYAETIMKPKKRNLNRPENALFLSSTSRGLYTGKYTMVVTEKRNRYTDAYLRENIKGDNPIYTFAYDNEKDPEQLDRIAIKDIPEHKELLAELARLLKETEDEWYEKKICSEVIPYK